MPMWNHVKKILISLPLASLLKKKKKNKCLLKVTQRVQLELQVWLIYFMSRICSTISCCLTRSRWPFPKCLFFKFKVKMSFPIVFMERYLQNYGVNLWPPPKHHILPFYDPWGEIHTLFFFSSKTNQLEIFVGTSVSFLLLMFVVSWFFPSFQTLPCFSYLKQLFYMT